MKLLLSILIFLFSHTLQAQYKIKLEITSLPTYHITSSEIYMAGSFNGWNPADKNYRLEYDDGHYEIKFKLPQGAYEYKFTRGSWDKVETSKEGKGIPNRELIVTEDIDIKISIEGWQDHFPATPKVSTASKQVRILDTAYFIPQLNRTRRIWIYLPKDYHTSRKRYPVLYMHDGQNLFDDSTSYSGEWGIDEFFDTTKLRQAIVVGIDHAGQYRLNEYAPYDMDQYGPGQGTAYVDFLVKDLKPYIDRNFRTLRDQRNTNIAGSSMGGLISMYAVLKYPNVFGGAGVFSPAFWVTPKIFDYIQARGKLLRAEIYFYAGKLESDSMVEYTLKAIDRLNNLSKTKMIAVVRDEGRHHESAWRREFPLFYRYLMME